MWHWISSAFSTYVLHVQHGNGYQWWSGMGANFGEMTIIGVVISGYRRWRQHNTCHVENCNKLGHKHPGHGFPVCRNHYHEELKI